MLQCAQHSRDYGGDRVRVNTLLSLAQPARSHRSNDEQSVKHSRPTLRATTDISSGSRHLVYAPTSSSIAPALGSPAVYVSATGNSHRSELLPSDTPSSKGTPRQSESRATAASDEDPAEPSTIHTPISNSTPIVSGGAGSRKRGIISQIVPRDVPGSYKIGDFITQSDYIKDEQHQTALSIRYSPKALADLTYSWSAAACQHQRRLVKVSASVNVADSVLTIQLTDTEIGDYMSEQDQRPFKLGGVISLIFAEHICPESKPPSAVYWVTYWDVIKACEAALDLGNRSLHMNHCVDVRPR